MKLHYAFAASPIAALLPIFSIHASALETTRARKLLDKHSTGSSSGNLFEDDHGSDLEESGPPEFVVEHVSFSKEEYLHGKGAEAEGPPAANIPAQVDMTAAVDYVTVGDNGGAPSRRGNIEVSDLGPDFSKVPVLVLKGFGEDNKPLVLKRADVNVPLPKIWKPEGTGNLLGEDAQVWYGEEVGGQGTASGMFMANANGSFIGSVQDGVSTYTIQTEYEEVEDSTGDGSWRPNTKYSAIKMSDLPLDSDTNEEESGSGRRLLGSNLRKVGVEAADVIEENRELQDDCDDIEGFYGPWYNSAGPYFDCNWYSQEGYRCGQSGHLYSNFGFTANQACCACGGGGVLVDVLVVYSSGTQTEMLNLVNLGVYQTNLALSMSGSNVRIRLVGLRKDSSYSEKKTYAEILTDLTNKNDGDLDAVHDWRDTYGADLVHYFASDDDEAFTSGMAANGDGEDAAFSLSNARFASMAGRYTFAHEIGHNMGCRHEISWDPTPGYDHGYFEDYCAKRILGICVKRGCTKTLMATSSGLNNHCWNGRILQYSNTLNSHNGRKVGDETHANCARAITERAETLKNFRPAQVSRTVELCKHGGCEGGSYRAAHTIGDWPSMPDDIENDNLSQVYIPQGLSFEYFEHTDFGGYSRAFGSPTNDMIIKMWDWGHNDAASSFKVRQIPSGRVKLCRDPDCSGNHVLEVSVGSSWNMPPIIGNDALSFVHVPVGYQIKLFEHSGFWGWSLVAGSKDYGVSLHLSTGWHDNGASSYIVSVL